MSNLKNCSNPPEAPVRTGIFVPGKLILISGFFISSIAIFQSCGPSHEEMRYLEESRTIADTVSAYLPGINTDTINGISHNFIRTADIKCKVTNVLETSKAIEDLLAKKGGYISLSNLSSHVSHTNKVQFKRDSVLESSFYTTSNFIRLRIPVKQLDSILREISDMALFIDSRNLKADDVKMDLFANALNEKRLQNYQSAVKAKLKSANDKISPLIKAEDELLEKQSLADNSRLNSYDLANKINYSTLSLELYQSEKTSTEVLFSPPAVKLYSPDFVEELSAAFSRGLKLLKGFCILLVSCWGIILSGFALFFAVKIVRPYFIKRTV